MEKEEIVIDLSKKIAETDEEICGTDTYRRWTKNVQG